jgi:hypothetical protein
LIVTVIARLWITLAATSSDSSASFELIGQAGQHSTKWLWFDSFSFGLATQQAALVISTVHITHVLRPGLSAGRSACVEPPSFQKSRIFAHLLLD